MCSSSKRLIARSQNNNVTRMSCVLKLYNRERNFIADETVSNGTARRIPH